MRAVHVSLSVIPKAEISAQKQRSDVQADIKMSTTTLHFYFSPDLLLAGRFPQGDLRNTSPGPDGGVGGDEKWQESARAICCEQVSPNCL